MTRSLADSWEIVALSSLRAPGPYSLVGGPFGSDLTSADYQEEPGVPVIRGTNLGGTTGRFVDDGFVFVSEGKATALHRNLAFPGDLVFTQRGTLGQVAIIPYEARFSKYVISQSQMKLTPDTVRVDSNFLFHYFRSPSLLEAISARTLATGVPHINLGILKALPVPLPPLPEQQRIAKILDAADALRARRRAALGQLDTLTQSIFLDMFGKDGSPDSNMVKLGEVADIVTGYAFRSENYVSAKSGIRLCRGANVLPGRVDWSDLACWPTQSDESLDHFALTEGDVVVAMDRPWISEGFKIAIVGAQDCPAYLVQRVARIRGKTGIYSHYLYQLLQQEAFKTHCRPTETTIPHISPLEIRSFPCSLPSTAMQKAFARRVAAVDKLKAAHRASLAELDALFASLQHRAFRGEL